MKEVRIGIIGMGTIGCQHAERILSGHVKRARVTAVADNDPARLEKFAPEIHRFSDCMSMAKSGEVDAVVVATPHFDHVPSGIAALRAGLHVMVEKPIAVHVAAARELLAAHTNKKQVFAAMLNQRTTPCYRKVKSLIEHGELGEIMRVNWIITAWFRSDFYYRNGGWRATWRGEGGGVLLNQCPHQLDLLQWICGMPSRMRAFCRLGKWHDIEVEDEVTAYMEYANGASGVFVTSTGEAPGTNRLEICGDRGRIIVEDDTVAFTRTEMSTGDFRRKTHTHFGKPPVWNVEIPVNGPGGQHTEILQNFVNAILDGTPLIAPAEDGIHSVELANAMLLSSLTEKTLDLPIDAAKFERTLRKLIATSRKLQ